MVNIKELGANPFLESNNLIAPESKFTDIRLRVPRINPITGISLAYHEMIASHILKYFNTKKLYLNEPEVYQSREANFQVAYMILVEGKKLLKYPEMFSHDRYRDIITESNQRRVEKIGSLVDIANELAFDDFEKDVYSPLLRLIRGKGPIAYSVGSSRLIRL